MKGAIAAGLLAWDDVAELGQVLSGAARGRGSDDERTFFKAMGVGIADVALGAEVLRRANAEGAGAPLPARHATH